MSQAPRTSKTKEWVDERGVRCFHIQGRGDEVFIDQRDLVKSCLAAPLDECENEDGRKALALYKSTVILMPPAEAYRFTITYLEMLGGGEFPDDFKTLRPQAVEGGDN